MPESAETLRVHPEKGLRVPTEYRNVSGQLVFRTPRATIQHWGGFDGLHYGMVDASSFGDVGDARNPHLVPDRVSIKREGEEAVVYTVEVSD